MKITLLFLVFFLLGYISVDGELKPTTELTDDKIRELMIGSWVVPPDASDRTDRGSKSVYQNNGGLLFTTFRTHKCQEANMVLNSKWRIQNQKLILYELKNSSGNEVAPGYKVVDRILSITEEKMVLQSEEDKEVFHRIKSTQCIE